MRRVAVFVDAGYVYAQSGVLLTGAQQPRETLALDIFALIGALDTVLRTVADAPLLRIYWYDAMRIGRPTPEQVALADTPNVKTRLGQVNLAGEQKGVDALIITDLAQLARNNAISDAILVSGDEDVRVGVVLAQEFGVRVHLLGIHPARSNQSRSLMQEADTLAEWDEGVIRRFMSYSPPIAPNTGIIVDRSAGIDEALRPVIKALSETERQALRSRFASNTRLPPEHDKVIIRIARSYFGQSTLTPMEMSAFRKAFIRLITAT